MTTRPREVSATEAAKNFGSIVDRVREDRAVYVVRRAGKPVAQIGPVDVQPFTLTDLAELLDSAPGADEEYLQMVETGIRLLNHPAVPKNRWGR